MNNTFFFKKNGFIKLNKFLAKDKNLLKIRKIFFEVILNIAKYNNLKVSKIDDNNIDKIIFDLKKINDKNIRLIHESINTLPELNFIFSSKKLNSFIKKTLLIEKKTLTFINNYSFRIQAPGRDEVSNLPWHRDSLYNNLYIKDNSIVVWISLSNISYEMGPVVFKHGSQKIQNLNKKILYKKNKKKVFSLQRKKNWLDIKNTILETKIGDVFLLDMDIIHKSGANLSQHKTKWSAQARFHFFTKKYIKKNLL